jgi:hypothetical protein
MTGIAVAARARVRSAPGFLAHEALTMAFYVAISLLAELAALDQTAEAQHHLVALLWGTAAGLVVAHLVAFAVAGRLLEHDRFDLQILEAIGMQVAGACAVVAAATVGALLVPTDDEVTATRRILAVITGVLAYVVTRIGSHSRVRALAAAIVVMAVALLAATVKLHVGFH